MIWWRFRHDFEMMRSWFGHDLVIIWLSFVHDFHIYFTEINQELNPCPVSPEARVIPPDYRAWMIMYWQRMFWLFWWFGDDLVMIWSWFGHNLVIIWLLFFHDFQNNITKLNQNWTHVLSHPKRESYRETIDP